MEYFFPSLKDDCPVMCSLLLTSRTKKIAGKTRTIMVNKSLIDFLRMNSGLARDFRTATRGRLERAESGLEIGPLGHLSVTRAPCGLGKVTSSCLLNLYHGLGFRTYTKRNLNSPEA